MASISWLNSVSGNWNTAANWSTGTVPGAGDDVTINVSSAATITHNSGTSVVSTLYTGSLATLAVTGGSLTASGYATLYGPVTQSAGSFILGPGSYCGGTYTQTGGTLKASAGTIRLDGTGNSFAGTITGSEVNFESGTDLLASGSVLSVGDMQVSGATVTLGQNESFTGAFDMTGGTLELGGNSFALGGNTALDGGATSGSGVLETGGNTTLSAFYLTGSTVLENTGQITDSNYVYVGYYGPDTAQLQNQASGTLDLLNNAYIYGAVNASLLNAGTLAKTGGSGTSNVNLTTTSAGAITVAAGTLAFNGVGDSFSGSIGGGGVVAFGSGSDVLASGLSLIVGSVLISGAAVTEAGNLAYAGSWNQTSGTLSLGGFTLSQTGSVALNGGYVLGAGTMTLAGATEFAGSYLSGSVSLVNKGSATQNATFYDGSSATDTTKITNAAGATYTIDGSYGLYGAAGASFANLGSLVKSDGSGTAIIGVSASNTGTISINQGTLRFSGANNSFKGSIGGAGTLEFNTGADLLTRTTVTVGHMLLDGATVTLGSSLHYTGEFTQTVGTLALGGFIETLGTASLEGGAISGSGTLAVNGATNVSGSAALTGSVVLSNSGAISATGAYYVGYYGSDTAELFNQAGATLSLLDNSSLYGEGASTVVNAGSIIKASGGGLSTINDSISSTGTLTVATGLLRLSGTTNSLGGVIGGAGGLELASGNDTLAAASTVSVGQMVLDGANLTLGGASTVSGQFIQTAGTLAMGGQTLTLSGAATFEGGLANGSGTIIASGGVTSYALALEGSTVFRNTGVLTVTYVLYDGYNSSDTAQFINQAAGTVRLLTGSDIFTGGASSFNNQGALIKSGVGTSSINASFSNSGTVTVAQGTLRLAGATNALAGTIIGAGTLELSAGATSVSAMGLGTSAVLLDGATVTIAANVTTAAICSQTAGVLALGGHTLALTGTVSLDGGIGNGSGTIAVSGATETYDYALEGTAALVNSGTLTVAAGTTLFDGYNSSDSATVSNLAAGEIILLGASAIGDEGAGTFSNAGSLVADGGGIKYISPAMTNTGGITVAQGTLTFQSSVGGAGGFTLDTGTQMNFVGATTGGAVTMGADSTLGVSTTAGFSDVIGGFAGGDLIGLNGFGYNSSAPPTLAFNATTDKLTVTEGTSSFVLAFSGSYTLNSFSAINDQGVIGITHT
jgi:fibronectin-binding autotransporter adhesin